MRVSEDELQELSTRCVSEGARSISDYLRSTVFGHQAALGAPAEGSPGVLHLLLQQTQRLERRMNALARDLKRVTAKVDGEDGC
jgi:hypothetical protein